MQTAEHATETRLSDESPRYRPIGEYGVIGDCRTAALVSPDGSIDWLCMPHFDSPAIFCRLLDADQGGYFQLRPQGPAHAAMAYLPDTNILETTFTHSDGRLRLVDFMPIRKRHKQIHALEHLGALVSRAPHGLAAGLEREIGNDVAAAHRISRFATCLAGNVPVELAVKVTFNYARKSSQVADSVSLAGAAGAILTDGERYLVLVVRLSHALTNDPPLALSGDATLLTLQLTLAAGQGLVAALNYARTEAEARAILGDLIAEHSFPADLEETHAYWRDWSARCTYVGTYQQAVLRSALALKLCTFEPTGAIVAAPTTSLPEDIGGVRNWDYRFTWLRDSAFTLGALGRLGYFGEARDYMHFLHDLQIKSGSDLRVMYGIRGEYGDALAEHELSHLEGYRGSRPVRTGNGAAQQCQLDIYGELLDAAYRYVMHAGYRHPPHRRHVGPDRNLRTLASVIADYVVDHWQDLDRGIWEVRGAPRAFVYSRAMCWVALDRACALAGHHKHHREAEHWDAARRRIAQDVLAHGYDKELGSFVQAYGARALDAANLRLPLVGFIPWGAPETRGTVAATKHALATDHALLYRYRPMDARGDPLPSNADDGLPGTEGAFLACAFWLVDTLAYLGEVEEARERFEELLSFAGPLGLFSEEIDPRTGQQLGNYPQAYTHVGLINSAVHLQRAQEGTLRREHGAKRRFE